MSSAASPPALPAVAGGGVRGPATTRPAKPSGSGTAKPSSSNRRSGRARAPRVGLPRPAASGAEKAVYPPRANRAAEQVSEKAPEKSGHQNHPQLLQQQPQQQSAHFVPPEKPLRPAANADRSARQDSTAAGPARGTENSSVVGGLDVDVDGPGASGVGGTAESVHGLVGSLDEYRQACLRLEKARHARLYDAERHYLYLSRTVRNTYEFDVRIAEEEFDQQRRNLVVHMLRENTEKMKRVEELRCHIVRDDVNGMFSRRHEMSLRGRGTTTCNGVGGESVDPEGAVAHSGSMSLGFPGYPAFAGGLSSIPGLDGEFPEEVVKEKTRRGKGKNDPSKNAAQQRRPQLSLELEEDEVLDDLAQITGEKRTRQDPVPPPEPPSRKSKKRK